MSSSATDPTSSQAVVGASTEPAAPGTGSAPLDALDQSHGAPAPPQALGTSAGSSTSVPAVQGPTTTAGPQAPQQQQQQADFLNNMPLPNPPENVTATAGGASPKTLWMGDLEPWWDEDYIVNLWKNMNKSVLVKVIKPKKNSVLQHMSNTGSNLLNHSGYCFVEFETYDEAKSALALNGSAIAASNNKVFRLNWASGATLSSQIPQTPEFSIFVGDLSPSTTEAHLLALFQTSFKSVKTVRVMTDPATGSSRCFGFVRFTDEDERRRALLEMNGVWLGGRPIRVALATPKHSNNSGGNAGNMGMNMNMGMGSGLGNHMGGAGNSGAMNAMGNGYGGSMGQQGDYGDVRGAGAASMDQNQMFMPPPPIPGGMPYYQPQFNQPQAPPPPQSQAFNDPTNTTVFVGGLANGVPEETLITLFEPFGPVVQVKIPQGKGCGFVKFAKREDAEQAIAGMQGFIIGGSRVRLSWGRSNHNNNINQQMLLRSQVGMGGGYDGYAVGPPPVSSMPPQGLPAEFAPPPPPQGIPPMYYAPPSGSSEPFAGTPGSGSTVGPDDARYIQQFSGANPQDFSDAAGAAATPATQQQQGL